MDFSLIQEQRLMQSVASGICEEYGLEYWQEKDAEAAFPHELWDELTNAGFMG